MISLAGRLAVLLLLATVAIGCGPPKAPEDIDALSRFLFREWENPTAQVMEDGIAKLEKVLAGLKLTGGLGDRSFEVSPPAPADLATIDWPKTRDPKVCLGSSVAIESAWPVVDHAKLQVSPEQLEIEPSATAYTRHFIAPTDPACLVERGCPQLITLNNMTRKNALLEVTYELNKRFRWIRAAEGRFALVARSWSSRAWPDENAGKGLFQSYTLDIWIGRADGKTWRYQATWSETKLGFDAEKGLQLAVVTSAVDGAFRTADTVIGKRYHGMQ